MFPCHFDDVETLLKSAEYRIIRIKLDQKGICILIRQLNPSVIIVQTQVVDDKVYKICFSIKQTIQKPILIITEKPTGFLDKNSSEVIADAILSRPFDEFDLIKTLKKFLSFHRSSTTLDQYKQIINNIPIMISLIDSSYNFIYVNRLLLITSKKKKCDILNKHIQNAFNKKYYYSVKPYIDKSFSGRIATWSTWIYLENLKKYLSFISFPYRNQKNVISGVVIAAFDNTSMKENHDKLHFLATTDTLTNVYNRQHFLTCVQNDIIQCKDNNTSISLIMLDIDNFKKINDSFGHSIGDKALMYFSQKIKNSIRSTDYIGRIGGEEFCICLPNTQQNGGCIVSENIIKNLNNSYFSFENNKLKITASIGISSYPQHGDTIDTLLNAADHNLYHAKISGKNCFFYQNK